jgi:type 1 glutamine amidotransferase
MSLKQSAVSVCSARKHDADRSQSITPYVTAKAFLGRLGMVALGLAVSVLGAGWAGADDAQWLEFKGQAGPGSGKRVVLVAGDEEYRSEELMPQLAKILSVRHGMDCTVLFPIDTDSGEIAPDKGNNIPGLHRLEGADLMIIATRFRSLPDDQMQHVVDYVEAGKPVIGLRTATHAFNIPDSSKFAKYSWNYSGEDYSQGFGRQVLGETWVAHHGHHGSESTRGLVADPDHPIATGIADGDIWGPSDVYTVRLPLPEETHVVFKGAILKGMSADDDVVTDDRNAPMMPIGWTRSYKGGRVFTSTMGAATDFANEGVRRMIVNATFWCLGLEDAITADLNVEPVGEFKPTAFGFGSFVKGKRPADYR